MKNWKDEFEKWKGKIVYKNNVKKNVMQSLNKLKHKEYDLVVLDEVHRLTENNVKFF